MTHAKLAPWDSGKAFESLKRDMILAWYILTRGHPVNFSHNIRKFCLDIIVLNSNLSHQNNNLPSHKITIMKH